MTLEPEAMVAGAALLILWGALDCFFGYRFFKFTIVLLGAAVGAVLGHQLFVETLGITSGARWIGFGVGAIAGSALAFGAYLLGVFILGFSLGFMLAPVLVPNATELMLLGIGAAAGIVFGLLALLAQKILVAVGTAWSGSLRIVFGSAFFIEGLDWTFFVNDPRQIGILLSDRIWMLVVFVVLGGIGSLSQLSGGDAPKEKEAKK